MAHQSAFNIITAVSQVEVELQQEKMRYDALVAEHRELQALTEDRTKQIEHENSRVEGLVQQNKSFRDQLQMKKTVLAQMRQHHRNLFNNSFSSSGTFSRYKHVHDIMQTLKSKLRIAYDSNDHCFTPVTFGALTAASTK